MRSRIGTCGILASAARRHRRLPDQAWESSNSAAAPGWIALTRIGASSKARVLTSPVTPPLTVETVVEPG
jgi:hypothetical protein